MPPLPTTTTTTTPEKQYICLASASQARQKKNCDLDINHRPLKHEPIKDMFILNIGMATSLISLCFSIRGIRSRELKLEFDQDIFHTKHLCEVTAKSVYK